MRIRNKLLLLILSTMLVVFAVMIYLSYISSKNALVTEVQEKAQSMLDKYRLSLNTKLESVEDFAKDEGVIIESFKNNISQEWVDTFLKRFVEENKDIYGSTISFVPGAFDKKGGLFGPYYFRSEKGLEYVDFTNPSYDYPKWDWFKIPLETGKPRWSPPYIDVGGGDVAMTTYSYPFFKDGQVLGVSTADLSLKGLTEVVNSIHVGKSGFAFLIDEKGTFLSLRESDKYANKTIFAAAEEFKNPELELIGRKMIEGKTGFISAFDPLIKKQSWFAFGPLEATGWSLAIVFPEDELLSELKQLHHRIVYIALAGVILIFIAIYYISGRITSPITKLVEGVKKITAGDFTTQLPTVSSKDEIGMLSSAFVDMESSLASTLSRLQAEKEQFKVAFSQMSDGLAILDRKCNVMQFNKVAGALLQLPTDLPLTEHLPKIFEGSFPSKDECKVKQCSFKLSRHDPKDVQKALHIECVIAPILGEKGDVKEYVFSARDVTGQELEERSKRDFLSLMSHKLFTPLSVLQGKLMLFKDGLLGPLDEKQAKQVNTMADQTAKLNDLIGSLVNFVSLEEAKFDTTREQLDLAKELSELAEKSRAWFADKNPEVEIRVAKDFDGFSFNKKLFEVIMSQLIENGLKFNLSIPPKVTIDCKKEGGLSVISVSDNGIGIPREYYNRIFEKFYQIEKYYTGNIEGVGLGLAYVKKIVDTFGGEIEVSSTPGKGSTFTVSFPA